MHNYGEFSTTGSVASESKSSIDSYSTPATPSTASRDEIKEYNEREVFIDLSKKLGEGAYGVVWKGRFHGSDVAIKELKVHGNAAVNAELLRELSLHNRIGPHTNVLTLLGVFRRGERQAPCIITDFMKGGSFLNRLCIHNRVPDRSPCCSPSQYRGAAMVDGDGNYHTPECVSRRPTLLELVTYAKQAAAGIWHIHRANIVHRDIACRNLLFDGNKVMVSDFGLSRNLQIDAGDQLYSAVQIGPVPWMAPESMTEMPSMRQFSTKSDVYMFGVLLFEIFTYGAQPWAGVHPIEIASRVRDGMTVLDQLPADAPLGIRVIMEQCLRYNRDERPSMESVFLQLQQLADDVESAGGDGSTPTTAAAYLAQNESGMSLGVARHPPSLLKQTKRTLQVYGPPLAFIAGAVVLGVAVAGAVSLWRSHVKSRAEIDTVKLLATLVPQDKPVVALDPGVGMIKRTVLVTEEPLMLRFFRFWNKIIPPPF